MAAAADAEENDLNFSDINSDDSDDDITKEGRPMIAHKDISSCEKTNEPVTEKSDSEDYEAISPPNVQEGEKDENEDERNDQNFEAISPVSDDEVIKQSESTKDGKNNLQFENISDDEEDKEVVIPEGKFSPADESENELNFDDENSNDSGYQIVKPTVKPTAPVNDNEDKLEQNDKNEKKEDDDDIEAPMPSPFSDIGDVDDMPETDGKMITDILEHSDTTEEQFDIPSSSETHTEQSSETLTMEDQTSSPTIAASVDAETVLEDKKSDDDKEVAVDTETQELTASEVTEQSSSQVNDENIIKEGANEDAGNLIANIFGDSDDEEEFEGFADEDLLPEKEKESDDDSERIAPMTSRDSSDEDDQIPMKDFVSDFDLMLQKRKEMNRMKRRAKKDVDIINDNDDIMAAMIKQMKEAAEEDRLLNQHGKAATKKLRMLGSVTRHLQKADLQNIFIDCGILPAMKDWLTPLPDHALPHINIRKTFLRLLNEFPPLDKGALKVSGIGRAVMLLFKHPKETVENKRLAGKIISNWARPIFNVSTHFQDMSREEREDRDKANLPEAKRRRLSSGASSNNRTLEEDDDNRPKKPGDKGWIGRARVPMPSHRDYVNRPVSSIDSYEISRGGAKKEMNRYEKHARKLKDRKSITGSRKAINVSLNGTKLTL